MPVRDVVSVRAAFSLAAFSQAALSLAARSLAALVGLRIDPADVRPALVPVP
ncbi:MAG TPA: hypothetical protein VEV45_06860 [Streptosporangiaceae bacterium]|nr:hypothetical protein [Streptosporangiaceae bacterium]